MPPSAPVKVRIRTPIIRTVPLSGVRTRVLRRQLQWLESRKTELEYDPSSAKRDLFLKKTEERVKYIKAELEFAKG